MTEPLYVTDGEIVKRMGVGIHSGRKAVQKMRLHPKFPPKDIGGKRYWPAVKAFLDFWNNLSIDAPSTSAGQENGNGKTSHSGRARPSLAAAQEWLGGRVAVPTGHRAGRVQTLNPPNRGVRERTD